MCIQICRSQWGELQKRQLANVVYFLSTSWVLGGHTAGAFGGGVEAVGATMKDEKVTG